MRENFNTISAVLFDLDGTLFDTARDLTTALNRVRIQKMLPPLDEKIVRPFTALGSKSMLKLAFAMDESHAEYAAYVQEFLNFYQQHLSDTTALFSGMEDVLAFLAEHHIPWGIVTNKSTQLTQDLLRALPLKYPPACIVCGDTLKRRKPYPDPLYHACKLLAEAPERCLYVGDTEIDVQASKAAGMFSLVAVYGYAQHDENHSRWPADGFIQTPQELIPWLKNSFHSL